MSNKMIGLMDYEKMEGSIEDKLKMFGKKTGSKKIKEIAKRESAEDSNERRINEGVIRKIVNNCLDQYMSAEYDFHTTCREISEALGAMADEVKPEKMDEDED